MKKLNIVFLFALFLFGVQAQKSTTFKMIDGTEEYQPMTMSPNGRYFVGGYFDKGFVYDRILDTLEIYDAIITGVSNTKDLQGTPLFVDENDPEGGAERVASIYDHGSKKWRKCQISNTIGANEDLSWRGSGGMGMSADGKRTTGWIWKTHGKAKVFVGAVWEDTVLVKELLPYSSLDLMGTSEGARPNFISADGKMMAGFGTRYNPYAMRSAMYWKEDGTPVDLGDSVTNWGEVYGYNAVQQKLVGDLAGIATIWNVKDGSRQQIFPIPGWQKSFLSGITDSGLVFGYLQGTAGTSPIVWSEKMGTVHLKDYCYEVYGLGGDDVDLGMFCSITGDGKILYGSNSKGSYVIVFGDTTVNSRPMNLLAKQEKDTRTVNVSWEVPLYNGRTVLGYNVYRDSVKVNIGLVTELKYADTSAPNGIRDYAVTAVYESGESNFSVSTKARVKNPGDPDCFPVDYQYSELIYNRVHKFHWGLPTDDLLTKSSAFSNGNSIPREKFFAPSISSSPNSNTATTSFNQEIEIASTPKYENKEFDFIDVKSTGDMFVQTVVNVNGTNYGSSWNTPMIYKYDEKWDIVENIVIEGLPPVVGFEQVGNQTFAICFDSYIYKIDLENKKITDKMEALEGFQVATHFCYIPELDGGNGGFEIGSFESSTLVKMDGTPLSEPKFEISSNSLVGSTYYNGKVYFSTQGENVQTRGGEIHEFDVQTKKPTGVKIDLLSLPEVKNVTPYPGASYAGNLDVVVLEDSTVALAVILQIEGPALLYFLELKSSPSLVGFNVYRNNVLFSGNQPLQKRNLTDTIFEPGEYAYQIETIYTHGCTSIRSKPFKVTIKPSTGCTPVRNITAQEINKNVILGCKEPDAYPQGNIVGLNIYRNGEKLNEKLHIFYSYVDKEVAPGSYTYRIEAFYDNSCTSSDSIQIEVTHQGTCEPVEYIYLKSTVKDPTAKIFDVNASWRTPFFEKPFYLFWGDGGVSGAIGVDVDLFHIATGWTEKQLETYKGYELVGIRMVIADNAEVTPIVLINEKLVSTETNIKFVKDAPFDYMFQTPYPITNDVKEMMVGLSLKLEKDMAAITIDNSAPVMSYGDLYSQDFKNWYSAGASLSINGNWALAAILAKPGREVSPSIMGKLDYPESDGIITLSDEPSLVTKTIEKKYENPQPAPEEIKLQGFNIYRNDVKLNAALLTDTSYKDTDLSEGTYTYKIGAVYNTSGEVMSKTKILRLIYSSIDASGNKSVKMYPNPTSNGMVTIEGEYSKVDVLDIFGRYITSFSASRELNLNGLSKGIYTLKFTHTNQKTSSQKLVIK